MTDRRALLTDREREIVAGEADVEDSYRYQTISRVRARFSRLEDDLAALEKHGALADELRAVVCTADTSRESDETRRDTDTMETTSEPDERPDTATAPRDDTSASEGAPAREQGPVDTDELPTRVEFNDAARAVGAARDYIRDQDGARKGELVKQVMPDHPLGYDVDEAIAKVNSDDRYRGGWWRSVVKPGLEAAPDVEKPPRGGSVWGHTET
jgi:hypothetical protein